MVGLSLSLCVLDIVEGRVAINDVETIVAGVRASNDHEWRALLAGYCQSYWHDCQDMAIYYANTLRDSGRLEQPRLTNDNRYPIIARTGKWVKSVNDIEWSDQLVW